MGLSKLDLIGTTLIGLMMVLIIIQLIIKAKKKAKLKDDSLRRTP